LFANPSSAICWWTQRFIMAIHQPSQQSFHLLKGNLVSWGWHVGFLLLIKVDP
jgi:hypothetical protein